MRVKINKPEPVTPPPPTFTLEELSLAQMQFITALAGAVSTADTNNVFGGTLGLYVPCENALRIAGITPIRVAPRVTANDPIAIRIKNALDA